MRRLAAVLLAVPLLALVAAAGAFAAKGDPTGLPASQVTALIQLRHPAGLDRFVRRVSDPSSPHYRRYATVESLVARFGAKPRASKRVLRWLAAHGVDAELSPTHMFVTASLPAERAAGLLSGAPRGAIAGISVAPAAKLTPHAAVGPAPGPESGGGKKGAGPYGSVLLHTGTAKGCAAGVHAAEAPVEPFTPNQYLTAYGDAAMHARGLEGEGQSVALVEAGGYRRSDIVNYDRCFGVKRTPPTSLVAVGGGKRPAAAETTLDLEQLSVAAPGLDHIYVYATGSEELNAMIDAAGAALGDPGHRPDVISISFGICEPQLSAALATRRAIDSVFAVAAGAGISVLVSSGDQGSSGCRAIDNESGEITALPFAAVSLPSSSPYATAVGGTNLSLTKQNKIRDEIVWNDSWIEGAKGIARAGGGGISILTPRTPWWQAGVHRYGVGRKVPDLAALADEFPGYSFYCTAAACRSEEEQAPGWQKLGGTSAATPLTAAGIALVNQAAEARGEPRLGFLNPLLYRLGADAQTRAASFFDVTTGNDNITPSLSKAVVGVEPIACCQARPGYDWASGWGSLRVAGFSRLALAAWPPR
jgi:kumamolisin